MVRRRVGEGAAVLGRWTVVFAALLLGKRIWDLGEFKIHEYISWGNTWGQKVCKGRLRTKIFCKRRCGQKDQQSWQVPNQSQRLLINLRMCPNWVQKRNLLDATALAKEAFEDRPHFRTLARLRPETGDRRSDFGDLLRIPAAEVATDVHPLRLRPTSTLWAGIEVSIEKDLERRLSQSSEGGSEEIGSEEEVCVLGVDSVLLGRGSHGSGIEMEIAQFLVGMMAIIWTPTTLTPQRKPVHKLSQFHLPVVGSWAEQS
nr:hypothetical protein Iba_chr09dCG12090 [Ipomoea batatas]